MNDACMSTDYKLLLLSVPEACASALLSLFPTAPATVSFVPLFPSPAAPAINAFALPFLFPAVLAADVSVPPFLSLTADTDFPLSLRAAAPMHC